jgi:hypothetical protein
VVEASPLLLVEGLTLRDILISEWVGLLLWVFGVFFGWGFFWMGFLLLLTT